MIRIGVIGYGYWGPNIVRNFISTKKCNVAAVCDLRPQARREVKSMYPNIRVTGNYKEILKDKTIDAVAIVTPLSTHFPLANEALNTSKHVLVEKPFTQTAEQAQVLVSLAKKKGKILMVDHTFVYTPAIAEIAKIIKNNELGNIFYIDCVRTNLGLIQKDTNVIYDLATHDFSIIDFLLEKSPKKVSATGISYLGNIAVAHISAWYPGLFAHIHVSWLSPLKIRTMIIVGSKKMLFYDDMEPSEKIKIYDKGISVEQLRIGYRTGSTLSPHLPLREGLAGVTQAFIEAVSSGRPPITDGASAKRTVAIVEQASKSL